MDDLGTESPAKVPKAVRDAFAAAKLRLKYLSIETTRHGKTAVYFRRTSSGPRIRLPDLGAPELQAAYRAALRGEPLHRLRRPTKTDVRRGDISRALAAAVMRARNDKRWAISDLTLEWAIETVEFQDFRCALSMIPFYTKHDGSSRVDPYAPSIDRIDCSRGYTIDNCRIVVFAMNAMLLDWGIGVFERVAKNYALHQKAIARRGRL